MRLETCDTTSSTNSDALAAARAGQKGLLWITARHQTAGRGRLGRTWDSPPGNLYASLLLTEPSPPERAPELSFVAALAVHDALATVADPSGERLALKWPNDVLLDGAKVAGVLIEAEAAVDRPLAIVVGIGINCTRHPVGTPYPATDLAAAGVAATAEQVFTALSGAMVHRLAQWDRGRNFAAVRADWLARAASLGETIRVVLPGRTLKGRFETVDAFGRLILLSAGDKREIVAAGDVFGALPSSARRRLLPENPGGDKGPRIHRRR
jgi:BirA family biotin operon repressor/biotin-[acetyl-CoA-carboxylase] ligase